MTFSVSRDRNEGDGCELYVQPANLAELCQPFEVRAVGKKTFVVSCNPTELESVRPLAPRSAEIKLCSQS